MEVTGILKVKFDTQKVSERFSKREFVLSTETNTPYPQHVSFQLTQDKCSNLDSYNIGDELKIQFNLRGREWTNPEGNVKYFNTLEAWRIERGQNSSSQLQQASPEQSISNNSPVFTANVEGNDDLPF
ncbi:MAG: DUF3127 domain-containing protein [Bacteroidetes bacterium]|nr:DUF3127 domain-containing protein [Bacteroidota bacterium]